MPDNLIDYLIPNYEIPCTMSTNRSKGIHSRALPRPPNVYQFRKCLFQIGHT